MARNLTETQQNCLADVTLISRRIRALEVHLTELRAAQHAAITEAVIQGVPQTRLQEPTGLSKGRVSQIASDEHPWQHRRELLRQWRREWEEWPADRIQALERALARPATDAKEA